MGAGVFGLSTALALTGRPEFAHTTITVVDRSPEPGIFPARDASSIDTSRIIRADYSDPAYAALAAEAQELWRQRDHPDDLGAEGRYSETGLLIVADLPDPAEQKNKKKTGLDYVRSSYDNVVALAAAGAAGAATPDKIQELPTPSAIRAAYGTGGSSGTYGYINRSSGWADAAASMDWLLARVRATRRVRLVHGTAASLLRTSPSRVEGVVLAPSGRELRADLTVLAAGAWTPSLVDLTGRAVATGQVVAYMDLTDAEQARLVRVPTLLNLSSGYFVITPSANVLKVARHAYGYLNPAPSPAGPNTVSAPVTHLTRPGLSIPQSEQVAMRRALAEMIPWPELQTRPFTSTKLCWYTDTPDGDFIIDYHPDCTGLFVATGASGHGFKFLPVIGDKITDCILGRTPEAFRGKWGFADKAVRKGRRWDEVVTEDGSRGGVPGLTLENGQYDVKSRL